MNDTRSRNMEKRRRRILEQARKMLAEGGFDALNLRDLAEVSQITVPTIYNLIGNKEQVLQALVLGGFEDFEAELESKPPRSAADMPALMMTTLAEMIARDVDYYRATALASERVEVESKTQAEYGFKRAPLRKFAGKLCRDALDEGLLRGSIPTEALVEQMISNHQVAFRDWAHRIISLQELKAQSLRGFYIALAADAVDEFRDRIVRELRELS